MKSTRAKVLIESSFSLQIDLTTKQARKTKPIPKGFHSITPYLFAEHAQKLVDFLKEAFGAKQTNRITLPGGRLMHTEVKIGDSYLMMGEPTGELGPMQCSIYLYVEDCDNVYKRAIKAGGIPVMEPTNMGTGERYGGLKDPAGNIWWVATHIKDVSQQEAQRAAEKYNQKST